MCWSNITSGIIKDMKIEPRNKWRKAETVNLDTRIDTNLTLAFIET